MSLLETSVFVLIVLTVSCGGSEQSQAQPMTAAEHRRAAEAQERAARAEEADSGTAAVGVGFPVVPNINADSQDLGRIETTPGAGVEVGTTGSERAAELRRHAAQHRRAAAALESFTDAACDGIDAQARSVSPLRGRVARVEHVDKGVRLVFAQGVDGKAVLAAARCHQAFARESDYEGGHSCPLYVPDVIVKLEPGGKALRVTSNKPGYEKAIRARTRHLIEEGAPP